MLYVINTSSFELCYKNYIINLAAKINVQYTLNAATYSLFIHLIEMKKSKNLDF